MKRVIAVAAVVAVSMGVGALVAHATSNVVAGVPAQMKFTYGAAGGTVYTGGYDNGAWVTIPGASIAINVPTGEQDRILMQFDTTNGGNYVYCGNAAGGAQYASDGRFVVDSEQTVPYLGVDLATAGRTYTRVSAAPLGPGHHLVAVQMECPAGYGGQPSDQLVYGPFTMTVERLKA